MNKRNVTGYNCFTFFIILLALVVSTKSYGQKFTDWIKVYTYEGERIYVRYQLLTCNEKGVSGIMYNPLVEIRHDLRHTLSTVTIHMKGKTCSGEERNSSWSESDLKSGEYTSDPGNWHVFYKIIKFTKIEFRYQIGDDRYRVWCDWEGDGFEHITINGKSKAEMAAEEDKKETKKREWEANQEEEDGNGVTIHYGFSNPNGITFKHKGNSYTFRARQTQNLKVYDTSGETIEIWECPNQTCRWSKFTIYPGNEYVITDSGNGRGLTLKKN